MNDPPRAAAIHRKALRLWWEREVTLPRFVRRAPDAIDVATGAWGAMVAQAEQEIAACPAPTPPLQPARPCRP